MSVASDITIKYLDILEEKFNLTNFQNFIQDLLNLEQADIKNSKEYNAGSEQYKHYIDNVKIYASYQDSKRRNIGVLIIKLQSNKNPANARTLQRNYIAHLLDKFELDATLAAIYSDTDETWRLSFVKQELDFADGKFKTKFTPAKRYSYLFGKDEPNHTAKEQLLELLENNTKKYSVEEIEEKFSVEKVTKDFFERYKENYLLLKENLENNKEFVSESERCDFSSEEFTKKLMGQIVFIYFLQKKGWLGVRLVPQNLSIEEYKEIYDKSDIIQKKILDKYYITFSGSKKIKSNLLEKFKENEQEIECLSDIFVDTKFDNKWGTGQKRFIRTIFENCKNRNKNFFDDYLEPFFYNGLNHKRKNQYFSVFNCKIPFLNGGLFEPLDNYQWELASFNINNDIFSNENETGILDFFDRYNFTMNEEEPLEKDVAVDPEMLGKIFENLLDIKDRKSKGAFYTPREIVHYMCQESIANYLVNKVGVDYNEIKDFIQYGEMIRDTDLKEATKDNYLIGSTIFNNIQSIDEALANIKIADPAVGSGAFPLGILNEIVKLRDILTSYILLYNKFGLYDKHYNEENIVKSRSIYNIKWNTIKNSIYAVDIENSAVDITKLRLWLSIVVEQIEVPKSGPEPLPNLDCKIMQGNSLIDEYEGIKLIDKKFIDDLKDRENVTLNDGGTFRTKVGKSYKQLDIGVNQIQFGDGQKKAQIDSLIDLKKELYGSNNPERKRQLLQEIQTVRKELLRLNFAGTNKEKELFEVDKSHNKPYFAWMLEFIEVFIENNGFDIVIGNPPYGAKFSKNEKKLLDNNYRYVPDYESYYYFINLSKKILKEFGTLSYINPNMFMANNFAKKYREYILNEWKIINIDDLSDYEVFSSAKVRTCIINFQKINANNELYQIKFNLPFYDASYKIDKNVIVNNQILKENIDNWLSIFRINVIDLRLLSKIKENSISIDDLKCRVSQGLIPYDKYRGHSEETIKNRIWNANFKKDATYKKQLKGGDVARYSIEWNGTEWISYGEWLAAPREPAFFKNPRILVREITNPRILACYTEEEFYNTPSIINIIDFQNCNQYYLLGILNSKLISYYSSLTSPKAKKGLFPKVLVNDIRNMPIKKSNIYEEKLISLVKEILSIDDVSKFINIDNKIDNIVYKIYGLNDDEINYIESIIKEK